MVPDAALVGKDVVTTPAPEDAHAGVVPEYGRQETVNAVIAGLPRYVDPVNATLSVPLDGDVAFTFWGAVGGELATVTGVDALEHTLPAST